MWIFLYLYRQENENEKEEGEWEILRENDYFYRNYAVSTWSIYSRSFDAITFTRCRRCIDSDIILFLSVVNRKLCSPCVCVVNVTHLIKLKNKINSYFSSLERFCCVHLIYSITYYLHVHIYFLLRFAHRLWIFNRFVLFTCVLRTNLFSCVSSAYVCKHKHTHI